MPGNSTDKTLIDSLFPTEVVTEEAHPMCLRGTLYPEEEAYLRNALPKRRWEFTAGRLCSRRALTQFGIENFPLLVGNNREPIWPTGIVGSISHTEGYCGVAIARKTDVQSIGLDVECIGKLQKDVWKQICTQQEVSWINSLPSDERQINVALVFSAKECLYKCQHTISRQWLGLHDVMISVNHDIREFRVRFTINNPFAAKTRLNGRYFFYDGYVFTGMTIRDSDILSFT